MNIDWINIIIGSLVGTVLGFLLVKVSDWSRKVKVRSLKFERVKVNFGILYKVSFIIKGYIDPGIACVRIKSKGYSTFAKWDETPNPLKEDKLSNFVPEKVPSTYYQPIFLNTEYHVPVIIEEENNGKKYSVFDGWWFGKEMGYYQGKELNENDDLMLNILGGGGLNWVKTFKIKNIIDGD